MTKEEIVEKIVAMMHEVEGSYVDSDNVREVEELIDSILEQNNVVYDEVEKEIVTTTQYLFGHDRSKYDNMTFKDAIKARYEDAKELYSQLMEIENQTHDDRVREFRVRNAMHWAYKRMTED